MTKALLLSGNNWSSGPTKVKCSHLQLWGIGCRYRLEVQGYRLLKHYHLRWLSLCNRSFSNKLIYFYHHCNRTHARYGQLVGSEISQVRHNKYGELMVHVSIV